MEQRPENKGRFSEIIGKIPWKRLLLLLLWAAVIVFCWIHRNDVTMDGIVRMSPRSEALAVLFMLGLFVLKSLTVVFYSGILYAVNGILFPLPLAIGVNLVGTGIMACIPYAIVRRVGGASLERYLSRHNNGAVLRSLQRDNAFWFAFLARIIKILPYDVASAYFGVTGTPFLPYWLGSVLGVASSCVLFPILGMNIRTPRSPGFVISAGIELAIALVSLTALLLMRRRAAKDPPQSMQPEDSPAQTEQK